ncbi:hypothetical protein BJY00DRAFT_313019 [Aspergillus carlsbadensis]|nr:hypothetical protein BJY00DRAFT_313019 [Aspergillus carlsbadensis]
MSDNGSSSNGGNDTQTQPGRLGGNTSDWNALGSAGESQGAKDSTAYTAQLTQNPPTELGPRGRLTKSGTNIIRHLEIQRDIAWANRRTKRSTNAQHRTATLLQRRGDAMQPECDECQDSSDSAAGGGAIFAECVAAPAIGGAAFENGACASCVWRGKTCSLRGTTMALDEGSVGQFVDVEGGEFSLREAIAAQRVALEGQEKRKGKGKGREKEKGKGKEKEKEKETEKVSSSSPPDPSARNIQTIPSSTFFGAFVQNERLNRVGVSQHGPRCEFDGDELRFPITRLVWEDPRQLVVARSDLAHFLAIVDARLFEIGEAGNDDSFFWRREARRLPALYLAPQAPPRRASPVQVPQTQDPDDETPEPEEPQPTGDTVIAETPLNEPQPPAPAPAPTTQDTGPVVPETQPAAETVIAETPQRKTPKAPTPEAAVNPQEKSPVIPETQPTDGAPKAAASPQKKSPKAPEPQPQNKQAVAVVIPSTEDPKTTSASKLERLQAKSMEIPDSQRSDESSSSDSDLPRLATRVPRKIRPFKDDDDDDNEDNAGVGAAGPSSAAHRPPATTTATRTVGGSGTPSRNTGTKDGGAAVRRKTNLDTTLETLNSIAGFAGGLKRRSGEGGADEPPEKRPKGRE